MNPASIIYALVGLAVGLVLGDGAAGAICGLIVGYLMGETRYLKHRLSTLEKQYRPREAGHAKPSTATAPKPPAPGSPGVKVPKAAAPGPKPRTTNPPPLRPPEPTPAACTTRSAAPEKPRPAKQPPNFLVRYFTSGNLVVRTGVIVLFFGIAFLIKYASDNSMLPIELRMAGVGLSGMAMLGVGWRLRRQRVGYALALQGGGIGVLYLTVFGAAKLFGLVSPLFALIFMILLVALAGALAVLQDAKSLAVLGTTGGFLAPVLASTGSGSHLMLFSYYLLLNCGILGIALFKSWRVLNLVGFIFTFGIGATWGITYYRPAFFATTEPFLVSFFLMYLIIAILFAHRQPLKLRGYVDGTLVFALPLAAFALQSGLVHRMPHGLAFSAVALAAVYITAATLLWRREQQGMRLLVESFLALGIMFATLAVPLATSGHWTAGAWALEGAALVWVGVRQNRRLARCAGLILQAGAGASALYAAASTGDTVLMSGILVSMAGFFSSRYLETLRPTLAHWERHFPTVLLAWGTGWWFASGIHKIHRHAPRLLETQWILGYITLSCGLMGWIAPRLNWRQLRIPSMGLLPCMILFALKAFIDNFGGHPFHHQWWSVWAGAFAVSYYLLFLRGPKENGLIIRGYHLAGGLLLVFLLAWEGSWALHHLINGTGTWRWIGWGAIPALAAWALLKTGHRWPWPVRAYPSLYQRTGTAILLGYLFCWCLVSMIHRGDPAPLPYVPLLNPMELLVAFIVLIGIQWSLRHPAPGRPGPGTHPMAIQWSLTGGVVFLTLSTVVARTVHHWTGIPFRWDHLARATLFQSSISILWCLMAMGLMGIATRLRFREIWFAGAGLLAVVVGKLFIIDLSGTGTIARIISFIAVGGLMLVIGYLSPLPPARTAKQEQPT